MKFGWDWPLESSIHDSPQFGFTRCVFISDLCINKIIYHWLSWYAFLLHALIFFLQFVWLCDIVLKSNYGCEFSMHLHTHIYAENAMQNFFKLSNECTYQYSLCVLLCIVLNTIWCMSYQFSFSILSYLLWPSSPMWLAEREVMVSQLCLMCGST